MYVTDERRNLTPLTPDREVQLPAQTFWRGKGCKG